MAIYKWFADFLNVYFPRRCNKLPEGDRLINIPFLSHCINYSSWCSKNMSFLSNYCSNAKDWSTPFFPLPLLHGHLEIDVLLGSTSEAQQGRVLGKVFHLHVQANIALTCAHCWSMLVPSRLRLSWNMSETIKKIGWAAGDQLPKMFCCFGNGMNGQLL